MSRWFEAKPTRGGFGVFEKPFGGKAIELFWYKYRIDAYAAVALLNAGVSIYVARMLVTESDCPVERPLEEEQ